MQLLFVCISGNVVYIECVCTKIWFYAWQCEESEATDWLKLAAKQLLVLQQVLANACQSYLTQQCATGGWTLLHSDPINFFSACHTFRHARSVKEKWKSEGAEVSIEARGNNRKRKWNDGVGLGNLRIPCILHWVSVREGKKCNYTCPLSLFRQAWCVKWGGSGGVCALWRPTLPYSMLIDACSAF